MKIRPAATLPFAVAWLSVLAGPSFAQGADKPAASDSPASRHVLPLLQDKIPEMYRKRVPLPYGISFDYFRLDERLALSNPILIFNGQPVPSELIQVGTLSALTNSYTARFDAWILPFLNVFGTATRFTGEATDIQAQVIGFPSLIPSNMTYDGSGVGTGFVAAVGYRAFFASYNLSYHWQFMEIPSNTVVVSIQGPRVGVQFTPWGLESNVYVGAMREGIRGRQSGTIAIEGLGDVEFDLIAVAEHPWSPTVGAELGVTRHIRANVEASFSGRSGLLLGAGYRF
jgi:hypothetical protein